MSFKGKSRYRKSGKFDRKGRTAEMVENAWNSKPEMPTENKKSDSLIFVKRYADLRNYRPIEVSVNKNNAVDPAAAPYNIIDGNCKVVDVEYGGKENTEGNTVVQMQNDTKNSYLMYCIDGMQVVKRLNYLYLPYNKSYTRNLALTEEYLKGFNEAVSHTEATMLTQLDFFKFEINSADMPEPWSGSTGTTEYDKANFHRLCALLHYQTVLQNAVKPISAYTQALKFEGELLRMSFRTEAPLITRLYGLLKKQAAITAVNTIGTSVISEYFDESWYKQTNVLSNIPSRKTKGMYDPLICMIAYHAIPKLTMRATEGSLTELVYDSEFVLNTTPVPDHTKQNRNRFLDPFTMTWITDENHSATLSFEELVKNVTGLLSPVSILRFVRTRLNTGTSFDVDVTSYFNSIMNYIDTIQDILATFTSYMGQLRTFLQLLENTGLMYWKKGFARFIDLGKITQMEPVYNVLLENIIIGTVSDAYKITWDNGTLKWKSYTILDKYQGYPKFNEKNRGAFITNGLRYIEKPDAAEETTDAKYLIPVLFDYDEENTNNIYTVDRRGNSGKISYTKLDSVLDDPALLRLNPLKQDISIKYPKFESVKEIYDDSQDNARRKANVIASFAVNLLERIFKYGQVDITYKYDTHEGPLQDHVVLETVQTDTMCFIDFEVEDVTNDMIVFARNYGPCKVATPDGERTMGFSTGALDA